MRYHLIKHEGRKSPCRSRAVRTQGIAQAHLGDYAIYEGFVLKIPSATIGALSAAFCEPGQPRTHTLLCRRCTGSSTHGGEREVRPARSATGLRKVHASPVQPHRPRSVGRAGGGRPTPCPFWGSIGGCGRHWLWGSQVVKLEFPTVQRGLILPSSPHSSRPYMIAFTSQRHCLCGSLPQSVLLGEPKPRQTPASANCTGRTLRALSNGSVGKGCGQ